MVNAELNLRPLIFFIEPKSCQSYNICILSNESLSLYICTKPNLIAITFQIVNKVLLFERINVWRELIN